MNERVLVTGGRGLVGTAVVDLLSRNGFQVRAASRWPSAVAGAESVCEWPTSSRSQASLRAALEGVAHVVHCAGDGRAGASDEDSMMAANAGLTAEVAAAAAESIPGKLVFLSSARAVRSGSNRGEVITDATEPRPQDAYGRSKLEGERRLRAAFGAGRNWTILRPVPIYGPGARGQVGALLMLARLPVPLPLAALSAHRSLLDRAACASAVLHALRARETDGEVFLLGDSSPVPISGILRAFRRGMGRRPGLFPFPETLLAACSAMLGQTANWHVLSGDLVIDPSRFARTGWIPPADTITRLEELAALAPATIPTGSDQLDVPRQSEARRV